MKQSRLIILVGCLLGLMLMPPAAARAKALLLDFGPTAITANETTNSPAHWAGAVPSTEVSWNTSLTNDAASLVYSDGTAASGVSIVLGCSTSAGTIYFTNKSFYGRAMGAVLNTGIYAPGCAATDGIGYGTATNNQYPVACRIDGLPAGTYTVYGCGRNTGLVSGGNNAEPTKFYGTNGAGVSTFTYSSSTVQTAIEANSWPPVTDSFVEGENYCTLALTLSAGQSLYVVAQGNTANERRGILNSLEIAGVPENANPALLGKPTVSIQQDHLTMTYSCSKAATNYAFHVWLSSNLVDWVSGTNDVDDFLVGDDGTNETRRAQEKTVVAAKPMSFLGLRVSKAIQNAKVVAFGDSITFGYGVPTAQNWVNLLAARFNLNMVNAGVSGDTSSAGLARIQSDVLDQNPDFVIINFGMNDHVMTSLDAPKVSQATFRSNLVAMIDRVRANNAIPILVTVNYIIEGDATQYYYNRHPAAYYANVGGAQAWLDSYIQIVRDVATEKRADLVDVRQACDSYDRYDFLRSLANGANTDDGVHPYILGSTVYANLIGDFLADHY